MSFKRRLLRIVLILFVVFLFAGYFAFSTFLFSPIEGAFPHDVSTLVPRGVDFFVAKARLNRDFRPFPDLAIQPQLAETRAWNAWITSPEYAELEQEHGIEATLAELRRVSDEQLFGMDPLAIFGGRDLALAGYFRGPDMAQADWAVYGRANWMGKLAASALSFPGLIGLDSQGIEAVSIDGVVTLTGGQLQRPVHVGRVRDVVVAGTSEELVRQAIELEARGGQDSFGQSAVYFDHVESASRSPARDEAEVFIDWRAYSEAAQLTGRWPPTDSQDLLPALMGRIFQVGSLRNVTGVLGFDSGATLELHGELSSELMTPVQKSIYRTRGVDRDWFLSRAATIARDDASLFLYLQLDIGDFLRQLLDSLDAATRQNLDDVLRGTKEFTGAEQLVSEVEAHFRDRIAIVVRDNDYPYNEGVDPPHNGEPVPAVSVVLWAKDRDATSKRVNALHDLVVRHQRSFGLQGMNEGDRGVFHHEVSGGFVIWEFWSRLVDGTGHLSSAFDDELYVVSNSFRMVEEVLMTYREGGSRFPRLADRPDFRALVAEGLPEANAILWLNPRTLAKYQRKVADRDAELEIMGRLDMAQERARIETEVLREAFPGKRRGQLDAQTQAEIDPIVDQRMRELRDRMYAEQIPAVRAALERNILYTELSSAILMMLSLDPKHLDLTASAVVPLDS